MCTYVNNIHIVYLRYHNEDTQCEKGPKMGGVRSNSPGNQLVHLVLTAGGGVLTAISGNLH